MCSASRQTWVCKTAGQTQCTVDKRPHLQAGSVVAQRTAVSLRTGWAGARTQAAGRVRMQGLPVLGAAAALVAAAAIVLAPAHRL